MAGPVSTGYPAGVLCTGASGSMRLSRLGRTAREHINRHGSSHKHTAHIWKGEHIDDGRARCAVGQEETD